MKHIYIQGTNKKKTLVLFHGTGGNEHDLIPIAKMIDNEAGILSIRGSVSENGMNRFFRRISEGIFDEEDILLRAKEISDFLETASEEYGMDKDSLIAVGYSNGANIVAAIHYLHGPIFVKSILFHPMVPLKDLPEQKLNGTRIFIGAGQNDPIVPFENTLALEKALSTLGAHVTLNTYSQGHSLTKDEVDDASKWYRK